MDQHRPGLLGVSSALTVSRHCSPRPLSYHTLSFPVDRGNSAPRARTYDRTCNCAAQYHGATLPEVHNNPSISVIFYSVSLRYIRTAADPYPASHTPIFGLSPGLLHTTKPCLPHQPPKKASQPSRPSSMSTSIASVTSAALSPLTFQHSSPHSLHLAAPSSITHAVRAPHQRSS